MRVSGARNHIDSIAVTGEDAGHRLDHAFESFVRGKQPKREKDALALASEAILIEARLLKRQVGDAMRNQLDLLGRDPEDLLQDTRGVLAHDDEAVGSCSNLVHYNPLVQIWFAKHRMQRCDDRHFKVLQQLDNVVSRFASKNAVFML